MKYEINYLSCGQCQARIHCKCFSQNFLRMFFARRFILILYPVAPRN